MRKKKMNQSLEKIVRSFLVLGVIIIFLEGIFVDFDIDSEYAIIQSYRLIKGDGLFLQMWEPHQTSAFLCACLIWIWLKVVGSVEGVVLFLHIMGALVKLGVLLFTIKSIKSYCDDFGIFLFSIFFLATSPKGFLLLEFSNMQIYFGILLFDFLLRFFRNQEKWFYLILAGLAFCLEVLSYPTCIFIYFVIIVFGILYCQKKRRDFFIFTSACVGLGGCFSFYYIRKLGWQVLLECIKMIIVGDSTHTGYQLTKWTNSFQELGMIGILYAGGILLSCMTIGIIGLFNDRKIKNGGNVKRDVIILFLIIMIVICIIKCFIRVDYYVPRKGAVIWLDLEVLYLPIVICGIFNIKKCDRNQKFFLGLGISLGNGNMIASLLLTNLGVNHALNYMVLAVGVSLVSIEQSLKKDYEMLGENKHQVGIYPWVIYVLLLAIVFKNGFIIKSMKLSHYNYNISEIRNVVKSGPAKGIFSDYLGPYIMNKNIEDWKEIVMPGDTLLIVGGDRISVLGYMYEDVNISVDSTICTPTYSEKLLHYWELNPEKIPNVVLVDSWYGDLSISKDSWIMQWIENEFGENTYIDKDFLRCYRK